MGHIPVVCTGQLERVLGPACSGNQRGFRGEQALGRWSARRYFRFRHRLSQFFQPRGKGMLHLFLTVHFQLLDPIAMA